MVYIRHISLTVFLGLLLSSAGCAMNPFQSARAPVESPAQTPTPPPPEPAKQIEQVPARETATVTEPAPVPEPPLYNKEETGEWSAEKTAPAQGGAAVVALLDDADQNVAAGRQTQAIASLERALRIEPKNPLLWHKLSRLRLEEKNWKQALALAKKSNVLAPGNKILQAENWKIIAQSSLQLGDKSGAAKAWEMVRQLEQ